MLEWKELIHWASVNFITCKAHSHLITLTIQVSALINSFIICLETLFQENQH